MSAQLQPPTSSQDDEKNLTILEHLQELRRRLMICGIAIFVGLIVSFYPLTQWFVEWLKKPAGDDFTLIFTEPLGLWTTFFQVSLQLAIAIAMPILVWQVLAFVGPGLTRNEKRWAYPIVFGASVMFLLGCAFAYYVEMPPALNFLFNAPGDLAEPFISFKSYVSFATRLMMVTGLVFETPLLVMGLAKVGVVHSRKLLSWWRFAIVGAFIVSAIVTPSIDPVTQTLVAGPMIVLYFVGIGLAKLVEGNPLIPKA
ncbi:MAG TPA: twin-arginine translocase subunit TatC [Dehalococcoidia bacterium]|nr:twin-arginine translocase subunit TatC [Dehalococcoidia bacterium]